MTTRDYYEILGLAPLSDGATVDQAYWHLAKAYQTQSVTDPRARQLLDELNEAYGVLGTPRLRDDYDSQLRAASLPARRGKPLRKSSTKDRPSWFRLPRALFGKGDAPQSRPSVVPAPAAAARLGIDVTPHSRHKLKGGASELLDSTTRMRERWRTTTTARQDPAGAPDMTLVDIFKTEEELSIQGDPLTAVMEVLKAPKDVVPVNSG